MVSSDPVTIKTVHHKCHLHITSNQAKIMGSLLCSLPVHLSVCTKEHFNLLACLGGQHMFLGLVLCLQSLLLFLQCLKWLYRSHCMVYWLFS